MINEIVELLHKNKDDFAFIQYVYDCIYMNEVVFREEEE